MTLSTKACRGVIELLTMAILRLTAWEQRSGGRTCLYADRTYD